MTPAKPFELSASRLKKFLQCPRSYHLSHVLKLDQTATGKYLEVGNDFDGHVEWYVSRGAKGVQNIDPKILKMFAAARPNLPEPGSCETQRAYRLDAGGFIVTGKADFRRRGWIGDAKTTSDRGQGRGKDKDTPPRALDAETLQNDVQSLLYGWCEFQLDPSLVTCQLVWTYTTKESSPTSWNVRAAVARPFVDAWFERIVRPAAAAMQALHAVAESNTVEADLDSCQNCWVKAHCMPFDGPSRYSSEEVDNSIQLVKLKSKESDMAFNLDRLNDTDELVGQLEKSVAKVQADRIPSGTVIDLATAESVAINPPPRTPREPAPAPVPAGVIIDLTTVSTKDLAAELLRRVS